MVPGSGLCQAEIYELDAAIVWEHYVSWLNVSVHEASFVTVVECLKLLWESLTALEKVEHELLQILAFNEFSDKHVVVVAFMIVK